MKIVTDDQKGIGQEKGSFVYVRIDESEDIDCGVFICSGDDYKPTNISDAPLIENFNGNVEFDFYGRSPLDEESTHKVGILSKDEIGKMIESLCKIYQKMQ